MLAVVVGYGCLDEVDLLRSDIEPRPTEPEVGPVRPLPGAEHVDVEATRLLDIGDVDGDVVQSEGSHRVSVAPVASFVVSDDVNVHDAVGGEDFFVDLVHRFYQRVATDLLLRPLYPDDLEASELHLRQFLQQYFGGPGTYSEQRGHPRLRARHLTFVIGEPERDAWLAHMNAALDSLVTERGTDPALEAEMLEYFAHAADFLVNAR